jgi:hypothetical protein
MQFLYPGFLFALSLAAIPVLIHLFNFRRYKKIVFSDIRFLKDFTEQNKKQQTLKHLLILLARTLAIASLVLAFAQPYFPAQNQLKIGSTQRVSIYIDNSQSMEASAANGSLLNIAKEQAIQLVQTYPEKTEFNLLTNDFEGKHQRWLQKKDILKEIDYIKPSATFKNAQEIWQRQASVYAGIPSGSCFWFSDFQTNLKLEGDFTSDSTFTPIPVFLEATRPQNVWIDSAWFTQPLLRLGASNKIKLRVKNGSEQAWENQPVSLKIDGIQKALVNMSCAPGAAEMAELNFSLADYNWHGFELSLTDFPITNDDTYFLAGAANQTLKVLLLHNGEGNKYLETVFKLDSIYEFKSLKVTEIKNELLPQQQLIILQEPQELSESVYQELDKFIKQGGVLLAIPGAKMSNTFLKFLQQNGVVLNQLQSVKQTMSKPQQKHPVMQGVFSKLPELAAFPNVLQWYNYSIQKPHKDIIQLENGQKWCSEITLSKGSLYVFGSTLNPQSGNFVQNALFVPLMLNLPLQARMALPASFLIGRQIGWQLPAEAAGKVVELKKGRSEFRAETRMFNNQVLASLSNVLPEAGVYQALADERELAKVALNYPRQESVLKFYNASFLKERFKSLMTTDNIDAFKSELKSQSNGKTLWVYFLIAALLFLIGEVLLLRLWK